MSEIVAFLSSIWRLFDEVNVPLLNISFADLWLGAFVVAFSITILRPLLGIGAQGVTNISKGLSHGRESMRNKRNARRASDQAYYAQLRKKYEK